MNMEEKAQESIVMIEKQLDELQAIPGYLKDSESSDVLFEKLKRWKERTVGLLTKNASLEEGEKLKNIYVGYTHSLEGRIKIYRSFLISLKDEIEKHPESIFSATKEVETMSLDQKETTFSRKIFIVHGSDENCKNTVARFLEKLDLEPIILHEQPNKGRTIIEKFEDYSNVSFAVVIMTPDDVGALESQKDNLEPRARQNVILELGFFLGKFGRKRVCPLYCKGVTLPSDYDGVVYVPMDAVDWRIQLAREIDAADIEIDFNKLKY